MSRGVDAHDEASAQLSHCVRQCLSGASVGTAARLAREMVVFLCVSCYACKMFQAIQQKKSSTKFACERTPAMPRQPA